MKRSLFVLAICTVFNGEVFAQDVNANLCQLGRKAGNVELLSSRPTAEIGSYLSGLNAGTYSFTWTLDGHEAANQLGLSDRFATIYAELAEETQLQIDTKGVVNISDVTGYLNKIFAEEKAIDALTLRREKHFSAIVYLRALQSAECAFPNIYFPVPTSRVVLDQLILSYPDLKLQENSVVFTDIYDKTIKDARTRAVQKKSLSIFRMVEDLREEILR